jgi:WD40 repeat protein
VFDLGYSADGRFLAASVGCCGAFGSESTLVWDLASPGRPLLDAGSAPSASALSPDGRRLYVTAASPRGVLSAYDTATGTSLPSKELLLAPPASVLDGSDLLEVSLDGKTLAVADFEDVVLLDAATFSVQRRLEASSQQINTIEFSHDGTTLAAGTETGTVVVWDVAAGTRTEELHGGPGATRGLAFSPDGATLYSTSDGLSVWDLRGDRALVRRMAPPMAGDPFAELAVLAPDSQAVAYFDSSVPDQRRDTIRFRDLTTGELGTPIATEHTNPAAAWRPDGERFATAAEDGLVRVWDRRRGELVAERPVAQGDVGGITYTQDGGRIVVGERSGAVFQVDAETLRPVGGRYELDRTIRNVFATPDGRTVLVLLRTHAYASIDLVDGTVVHRDDLEVEPAWLDASPDGTRLAVGATTGQVGVIDIGSGEWIRPPIDAHGGWVQQVAYAPDGTTFASSGNDGQVVLWDGRTGERVGSLTPTESGVWTAVDFQSDGHTLLIAGRDGAVRTVDTRLQSWIDRACDAAGRELSEVEWADALGDRPYHRTCPPHAD